jgi:hypothetical protein
MSSNDTLEQLRDDIDSGEPGTKSPLLILRWRRSVLTMRCRNATVACGDCF